MKLTVNKYKRWNCDNGKFAAFLRDNYTLYDNRSIAYIMGRTVDAVRKQLKKMRLKRPRKTKIRPAVPQKRGRKKREMDIFDMLTLGAIERDRIKREKAQAIRQEELKRIEKKRYLAEFTDQVIPPAPSTEGKEFIVRIINGKQTIIFGNAVKASNFAERCQYSNRGKNLTKNSTDFIPEESS